LQDVWCSRFCKADAHQMVWKETKYCGTASFGSELMDACQTTEQIIIYIYGNVVLVINLLGSDMYV
jgi:hypothetical protein